MTPSELNDQFHKQYPDETITVCLDGKWRYNAKYVEFIEQQLINHDEMIPTLAEMQKQVSDIHFYYINAIKHLDEDQIAVLIDMLKMFTEIKPENL